MASLPSRSLADDMLRVSIHDMSGHLIRVLDLKIVPGIVLQGEEWHPGVEPPRDERDLEAIEICGMINEGGFALDADGLPSAASGDLFDDDGNPTAYWKAERLPKEMPRPSLNAWQAPC
jgi:hypothetical protein